MSHQARGGRLLVLPRAQPRALRLWSRLRLRLRLRLRFGWRCRLQTARQAARQTALQTALHAALSLCAWPSQALGVKLDMFSMVFGESVLNDAVAIVLSRTLLSFNEPSAVVDVYSVTAAVLSFLIIFVGSAFIGSRRHPRVRARNAHPQQATRTRICSVGTGPPPPPPPPRPGIAPCRDPG